MSEGRFARLEFEGDQSKKKDTSGVSRSEGRKPLKHFITEIKDEKYFLKQAQQMALAGEHEKALRSYASALGENPLSLKAWLGQVFMLIELQEYPEGGMWADKALESFPDHPQLLSAKAIAFHRMGRRREARGFNDLALQTKGESEIVWLCRGEIMLDSNSRASTECFQHAQRLAPGKKGEAYLQIGSVYLRHQKYSHALFFLQKATNVLTQSAWAWYLLGKAQAKLGKFSEARVAYQQACELNPRNKRYQEAATLKTVTGLRRWWQLFIGRFFKNAKDTGSPI